MLTKHIGFLLNCPFRLAFDTRMEQPELQVNFRVWEPIVDMGFLSSQFIDLLTLWFPHVGAYLVMPTEG